MNVTLNIGNDTELRSYIKDCIKGQVLAIVREDFQQIVKDEIERKVKGLDKNNFNYMLEQALRLSVSEVLNEQGVQEWSEDFIRPFINTRLDQVMKHIDFNKLIDAMAVEKVKALIK